MTDEQTFRFSLRLPKELHQQLTVSANEANISLNSEILRLLEKGIEKESEQEPDKTLLEQLLPPILIWRIARFSRERGISTNEEAAKRLIKMSLDEIDTVKDILDKIAKAYIGDKDLRIIAKETIASHSAVDSIKYGQDYVWFHTKNGESGAIDKKGKLYFSEDGYDWDCNMEYYNVETPQNPFNKKNVFKDTNDLDDEIPF